MTLAPLRPLGEDSTSGGRTDSPEAPMPLLRAAQEPCVFVIFGASGDLTGRKLIPGLYNLSCQELLPPRFSVVGFAITPLDTQGFRERMRERVKHSPDVLAFRDRLWDEFAPALHYLSGDFEDPEGYQQLAGCLAELDAEHGSNGNRLFYLATPPSCYGSIVHNLAAQGLVHSDGDSGGWTRVIVEKPLGFDLDSARRLNAVIHQVFEEDRIYRIDHYLGKETVQNLLAFRFANSIIEPIWNRNYVDHVQITAAETLGVEHRGAITRRPAVCATCFRTIYYNCWH
jgi:glucose-6-phosphate 1-dehydrogenase